MGRGTPGTDRVLRSDARRNRERVITAAVVAIHRDGPAVPMATIAAEAGVGIGTLYRHFASRDDLIEELTYRSMKLMLTRIEHAVQVTDTAIEAFRLFLLAVIGDRNDLVLRTTGGPSVDSARSRAVQKQLHEAISGLIARGGEEGSIKRDIGVLDIAWLGATMAQPGRDAPSWDKISGRLLDTYLAGLGVE